MKVKWKNRNAKSVNDLDRGECFLWGDKLFIVTDETSDGEMRCVALASGIVNYFIGSDLVIPVDAEVVVHD